MAGEGQWTVDGSVEDFRLLQARLRDAGAVGLRRNMRSAIVKATAPARQAVKAEVRQIMPQSGGLAQTLGRSSVTASVLTGARSAGVRIRMRGPRDQGGHNIDVRSINAGVVRHPVFGNRNVWATTKVPSGWWNATLDKFGPVVEAALVEAMNVTAREAGFTR